MPVSEMIHSEILVHPRHTFNYIAMIAKPSGAAASRAPVLSDADGSTEPAGWGPSNPGGSWARRISFPRSRAFPLDH